MRRVRPASSAGARRSAARAQPDTRGTLLDVTQPALSKTLARLRRYFDDPLFVRVSHSMEPTPKALALREPVGESFEQMRALRSEHVAFDPKISTRTFNSASSMPA